METLTVTALPFLDRTVGSVVADDFRRGAVFKQFGIDFCCGGGIPVREACARKGVDPEALQRAISSVGAREQSGLPARVTSWPPTLLIDYIVAEHHAYVRESLPVLLAFSKKVARVHGAAQPELVAIAERVEALDAALGAHLAAEEDDVFPAIRALASDADRERLAERVAEMEREHEDAGALMAEVRTLTDGFTPPDWACNTYRALYAKLEEFEGDLHRHVHLENNVLFPTALRAAEESGA